MLNFTFEAQKQEIKPRFLAIFSLSLQPQLKEYRL